MSGTDFARAIAGQISLADEEERRAALAAIAEIRARLEASPAPRPLAPEVDLVALVRSTFVEHGDRREAA